MATEHALGKTAAKTLAKKMNALQFRGAVHYVYNPLDYARRAYFNYLEQYARPSCRVVFLGMNPGPWGMAQTGVPFGEIKMVRDWLQINGKIERPEREHASRPVLGWECKRSEVSGKRLWGLFQARFGEPDAFFAEHFVVNYCPLLFLAESGANVTPDKLPVAERAPLEAACDDHLRALVGELGAETVVGVGGFAEKCARRVFGDSLQIAKLLHPSPASPGANRDWAGQATQQLISQKIWPGR